MSENPDTYMGQKHCGGCGCFLSFEEGKEHADALGNPNAGGYTTGILRCRQCRNITPAGEGEEG